MKKRLISMGNFYGAADPFADLFREVIIVGHDGLNPNFRYNKDDVLILGGGADISPSIYNQKPSRYAGAGANLSRRDAVEVDATNRAFDAGIPSLGICRGAQLLCALSGGSLYQHVVNHANSGHLMKMKDGKEYHVSSAHHQMMNPFGTKHELLGWSSEVRSNVHIVENEKNPPVEVEPEIVYFLDTKALAIQYHPEFMHDAEAAVVLARDLVKQYLLGEA